jgi:hypothetical protein
MCVAASILFPRNTYCLFAGCCGKLQAYDQQGTTLLRDDYVERHHSLVLWLPSTISGNVPEAG